MSRSRRVWRLFSASIVCAAILSACGRSEDSSDAASRVSVHELTTGQAPAVEVRGLGRTATRSLSALAPNDTTWRRLVAVYVERTGTDSGPVSGVPETPPVIGRYSASDDRVRFEPRFPFAPGVAYRVEVDTAAVARLTSSAGARPSGATRLVHGFTLPSVTRARTTRVVAVHPSSPRLPENLLRWYVETSAPMEVGSALAHIHLVDEAGREVQGAFLALDQELWDPERRRLTLLLDPGRVKRGVRTNLESGAPLVAGRRYRLMIDAAWKDGTGASLASGYELAFEASAADRQSPAPDRWRLTPPPAGTRSALHVSFGEPLDHGLARHLIDVLDAREVPVPGSVELAANDSAWVFSPRTAWTAGEYTLRVGGALEDVAGNNVARVFDVDRRADSTAISRDVSGSTRSVRFRIL